ncbi:hypothetical protein Tco_0237389 [Tanacetum coccineum]
MPAYKTIMKCLRNYPLYNAFTNCPSVVYQNFLREFWSTAVAFDPFPSTDEPQKCTLKEFLIKFSTLNGQRPLTFDFHTFCSLTGLDYNNGKYVAHPTPKVVKKELGKITINPSYLDKTPVLKNSFPVAWRILFTFVIQIHLKTKLVFITVYRGTDGRNFKVHEPFLFGAFGISELDELREIIPKKKNAVVKDLINYLSRRYERLKKIPKELRIHSALPTPAPEQASSRSSGRKQKHMELEPKTRIPGLECNRALPENVSFINNMVIKEPEYGNLFTDEVGDQAFQRWSDIDKVGMEALVSYLVAASMVKSTENARFSMKLGKLIAEHPDQEKLKSKKVKLEALGYKMD